MTGFRARTDMLQRDGALIGRPVIDVPREIVERIRVEAESGYPEEICGVLVGRVRNDRRVVERAVPVDNARDQNRSRRYLIPADTLVRIERAAGSDGAEVIGFYHSHPDHPAVPSAYDREHSWPWYTYVIIAVTSDSSPELRAWRLSDDRSRFDEHEIRTES